jgi:DHA2 family multidrug resistance protein
LRWTLFRRPGSLVTLKVFTNRDYCFGFLTSFVAGVALFGSTWLIPNFTLNVLGMTAVEAGSQLVPGGALFILGLLTTALLIAFFRIPTLLTVPPGILLIMTAMWMLSGSTSDSGVADMSAALMIRGAGLGLLFLALTLFTFGGLTGSRIAQGVAFFTTNRQLGGLFGVAFLQRYMDHQNALNGSVLSSHLNEGGTLLTERLNALQAVLQGGGIEAGEAAKASLALVKKTMIIQSNTLSFNECFFAVVLVFAIAAPILVSYKIWLGKRFASTNRREKDIPAL